MLLHILCYTLALGVTLEADMVCSSLYPMPLPPYLNNFLGVTFDYFIHIANVNQLNDS